MFSVTMAPHLPSILSAPAPARSFTASNLDNRKARGLQPLRSHDHLRHRDHHPLCLTPLCVISQEAGALATAQSSWTPLWAAPEVVRLEHGTVKADIWSYGICIFELVSPGLMVAYWQQ